VAWQWPTTSTGVITDCDLATFSCAQRGFAMRCDYDLLAAGSNALQMVKNALSTK
jgi:hypothetical protein